MVKNKFTRYLLIAVGVMIGIGIIGKSAGWWGGPKLTNVTTEKATLRTIIEVVSASGKIQPELEVKISPDVSGEIVELYVKEGQEVKKGELLCKIKPDLYESALNRSTAALNTSRANMANAKARLSQVKAQFQNTQSIFERNKKLYDQGAISQSDFEASNAQYEAAKSDVTAAEETLNASEYNINSAQATVKESNDNLARTTIYSPVTGIVTKLNIEQGERVVGTSQMAGTEIMRISNIAGMEVNVDVNENDIVRLHLNDTADIEVDAYLDRKFKGTVTEIANSANTVGVSADQVTNFTVKVRILPESYQDLLKGKPSAYSPFRPGMSATVDVKTNKVISVISVPIQAVTVRVEEDLEKLDKEKMKKGGEEDPNEVTKEEKPKEIQEYVFVNSNGEALLRPVKTGVQDNSFIQIVSGVKVDEEIISGPYTAVSKGLKDKEKIKVVTKEELYAKTDKR